MHRFEKWILQRYLLNAIATKQFANTPPSDFHLVRWLEEYCTRLQLPPIDAFAAALREPTTAGYRQKSKLLWRAWRNAALSGLARAEPTLSVLERRVRWIAGCCGLTQSQTWLFGLLVRTEECQAVREFVAAFNDELVFGSLTYFWNCDELQRVVGTSVDRADCCDGSLLIRLGLIDASGWKLTRVVRELIVARLPKTRGLTSAILGPAKDAHLEWGCFSHLGDMKDLAVRIVQQHRIATCRNHPVNILIYGEPGTGKTEFVKSLGAYVGSPVYFIGEADDEAGEPNRNDRIASLLLANALGVAGPKMVLVVDEADDLFAGVDDGVGANRRGSKVFMNRLVEQAKAPTFWITNNLDRLGPAVIRRMTLVMRFPKPPSTVRRGIAKRLIKKSGLPASDGDLHRLSEFRASPALLENAVRSASMFEGTAADALKILELNMSAMGESGPPTAIEATQFDPDLSSADIDLRFLADRIARSPARNLSLCLSGAPGTGKSAYAQYLARKLDMEPLEKRYSQLSSMYLGETEKGIAAAFEEASDLGAFLIFDEADSLLRDRGKARQSWEITQVNEMLIRMERHQLPFVCTTNAPDGLDPAAARRFVFKVKFLEMTADQIASLFERTFNTVAPRWLLGLDGLTPGDIAVVSRKAGLLGEGNSDIIARWLADEVAAKPDGRCRRIGF